MSEEFDKEAEREKLREKLENDQQKRQETQRMSELLLQGATMTNEHCERCGDPLFRDGERTFCPTCSGADGQAESQQSQPRQPSERTQAPQSTAAEQSDPARAATVPQQADAVDDAPAPTTPEPASTAAGGDQRDDDSLSSVGSGDAAGVDPRAELQRAVARSARKANEATDPRTAKQWLEASKEAAEALDALER